MMKENNVSDKGAGARESAKPRAIVGGRSLEYLKRRAEELGLIIHNQAGTKPQPQGRTARKR